MPGDIEEQDKLLKEQQMFQILFQISNILNTGLDAVSLTHCIRLCENGVNPEGLAKLVTDMRQDVKAYKERKDDKGAAALTKELK